MYAKKDICPQRKKKKNKEEEEKCVLDGERKKEFSFNKFIIMFFYF